MKEIMEEYGDLLVEAIAACLVIAVVAFLFLGGGINDLVHSYMAGILGV